MEPKLPLQKHLEIIFSTEKIIDLNFLKKTLAQWKEDYELILEIKEQNKCTICDTELHWIHKLRCPQKVYKEGFKFLYLYKSLTKLVEIENINEACMNFYNEYMEFKHNPDFIKQWELRISQLVSDYFYYYLFEIQDYSVFIYDDNNKLITVKPSLDKEFNFEILIQPDTFYGFAKFFKLIEEEYEKKGKALPY